MNNGPLSRDIAGVTFLVLCIGGLIAVNFWILQPFLLALIWATIIVVATWPIMLFFQRWLGGRRSLAVALMTLALLLVFIIPFLLAVGTIVDNADRIVEWAKGLEDFSLPPLPDWIGKLPAVGAKLNDAWQEAAATNSEGWLASLAPHTGAIVKWFTGQAGSFGMLFVQFFLTLVIAAVLYTSGETAGLAVRRFTFRLAGQKAEESVILAARTIRGVALGICLTALTQSLLAGIGFVVTGVPFAGLLAAFIFILALAQLPPFLVMAPAVIWLYWKGDPVWGTVLLVWTIVISGIDNILRPFLIRKGVDLPLLLIFTGVIGGLIAFGIIGLFIGPVVLAATYKLLEAWVDGDAQDPAPASAATSGQPIEAGGKED